MKVEQLSKTLDLMPPEAEVMVGSISLNYPICKSRVCEPVLGAWVEGSKKRVFLEIAGDTILPI